MVSQHIFALGDVHASEFGDVGFEFIDGLGVVLLFDNILNLL